MHDRAIVNLHHNWNWTSTTRSITRQRTRGIGPVAMYWMTLEDNHWYPRLAGCEDLACGTQSVRFSHPAFGGPSLHDSLPRLVGG